MKSIGIKYFILITLIFLISQGLQSQNLDSLLEVREIQYQAYMQYKQNLGERTWIKLLNLSDLASKVIQSDNQLVNYYSQGIKNNGNYKAKIEELNLEITLLKREAEIQEMVLNERKSLFNTLLMIVGGVSILFIAMLIFAIDRHIRFRNTKMELERTWAGEIEIPKVSTSEQEFVKVNNEIRSLSTENSKLKDQVLDLMNKIKEKEKILDEELDSRKQLKDEIRNLITQIKSQ
jgi:hypothetical protein